MSLIHRLFGAKSDAAILCPRCERALEGHDDGDCARRMSRRYFFGVCAGAAAVVVTPPLRVCVGADWASWKSLDASAVVTGVMINGRDWCMTKDVVWLRKGDTISFDVSSVAAYVERIKGLQKIEFAESFTC